MKMNRILFGILFVSFFFYSCENDDDYSINNQKPIEFSSDISYKINTTKASGSSWDGGDKIGIFMKSGGTVLSEQSIIDNASNVSYRTSGNGIFVAETTSDAIYFPADNSFVDFIAYYPYRSDITSFIYEIDVTDQSIPENIDFLYSNNLANVNNTNVNNSLIFTHQLSTIRFNISIINDNVPFDDLTVTASGMKTKADFDLTNGSLTVDENSVAAINFRTTINSSSAYAEAVLLPDNGGSGRTITFGLPSVGTNFKWTIPSDTQLGKGRKYTYNIKLDASGVIVEEDFGWVETPLMKNVPDKMMYVTHMMADQRTERNYSLFYDTDYKFAHWVAYPLHKSHIGNTDRTDKWQYDPIIPQNLQPYIKKAFNPSSYSRGHQIASADRTRSESMNAQTFYYTNMTPQIGNSFNGSIWAELEKKVRNWATALRASNGNDTLYVVTGVMTTEGNTLKYAKDNNGVNVVVPDYYYKALAKEVNGNYYTIAFRMDHKSYSNTNYNEYRVTVEALEKETGYTFFPSIPKEAKTTIVTAQWN